MQIFKCPLERYGDRYVKFVYIIPYFLRQTKRSIH